MSHDGWGTRLFDVSRCFDMMGKGRSVHGPVVMSSSRSSITRISGDDRTGNNLDVRHLACVAHREKMPLMEINEQESP